MTTNVRVGANASETRIAVVEEAVWSETPASPSFQNMRFTSETLMPTKETVRSDEIRADRNVIDEIEVGRSVGGNLEAELSYETFDDLLKSNLFNDWAGSPADTLKNGVDPTAFTFERRVALPGGTFDYMRLNGCVVDTFSLSATAGQLITCSFGVQGRFGGRDNTVLSGATYADANENRVLNAATHFAQLTVGGLSPSPRVMSLTLETTNNLRRQAELGQLDTAGLGAGRFEVTGTMECYFESGALLQSFLDHDDLSLSFVLGTEAGQRYRFTLPTIILTGEPGGNATGNDADIMLPLSFTAVLDRLTSPRLECTLQIERGV